MIDLSFKNKTKPSQGKILISEPFIYDTPFKRSVILIAEHNKKGTIGFILNKPLDLSLNEALTDFPKYKEQLFYGGPVGRDQLYFVHTLGNIIKGSMEITEGLYWGGDFDQVKDMIENNQIKSTELRFFAGYSGWEPKQLDKELKENTWVVTNLETKSIFADDTTKLWKTALSSLGKEYSIISNFPEDPMLN